VLPNSVLLEQIDFEELVLHCALEVLVSILNEFAVFFNTCQIYIGFYRLPFCKQTIPYPYDDMTDRSTPSET
jgi:hypothetical protein